MQIWNEHSHTALGCDKPPMQAASMVVVLLPPVPRTVVGDHVKDTVDMCPGSLAFERTEPCMSAFVAA